MIVRAAFLALFLLPGLARAQNVSIRSGEHADFSRLVLEFEDRVTWSFGRVEGGYELRADAPGIRFDASRVFALIPRTRISALEDRGNGRLFIASACDCHGDAFDLRTSELVLDIKDGPAAAQTSPFDQPLPDLVSSTGAGVADAPDAGAAPVAFEPTTAEATLPRRDPLEARAGLPITFGFANPLPMREGAEPATHPPATAPAESVPVEDVPVEGPAQELLPAEDTEVPQAVAQDPGTGSRVSETEEALLRQIGRAAAQGLLDADLATTESAVTTALDPVPAPVPLPDAAPPEVEDPEPSHDPTEHMHIQTVIDRDLGLAGVLEGARTEDGNACLPAEHFDIASWGLPPVDGADLSLHRAAMLGEFDQANPEHVLGLVRNYIHLTFGAEAVAVARRYEADLLRPDLLVMMGEVMDFGESRLPAALVDQMACDGPVALWATLAQPELAPSADIDRASVIRTFSELPVHLRRHLGPGLSQKFLRIGDVATAQALRDALARAPGYHGSGFDLLEAHLDRSGGDDAAADARLTDIINADGPVAPEALLAALTAQLERGKPVEDRLRELATSMAYEHRGTAMGAQLLSLATRAEAGSARFDAALVLINEAAGTYGMDAAGTGELREVFFEELVMRADDATFLIHAVPEADRIKFMAPPIRREIVARLLQLGFVIPARASLSNPDEIPEVPDRLLFAQVALLEGRPEVAMGYLAGLEGEDATRLRAKAQSALSDHHGAALSWAKLDEDQATLNAAWLAGDWELLGQGGDTPYRDVARAMMETPSEGPDAEVVVPENAMSRGQSTLSLSQQTRSALTALLEQTDSPLSP